MPVREKGRQRRHLISRETIFCKMLSPVPDNGVPGKCISMINIRLSGSGRLPGWKLHPEEKGSISRCGGDRAKPSRAAAERAEASVATANTREIKRREDELFQIFRRWKRRNPIAKKGQRWKWNSKHCFPHKWSYFRRRCGIPGREDCRGFRQPPRDLSVKDGDKPGEVPWVPWNLQSN